MLKYEKLWFYLACFFVGVCLVALSGCGSYQPPGEDLWKAL